MALSNEVAREARERHCITLAQAAVITGYSKSHIQAIEAGDRTPNPEYLSGLFRATFDCTLPQLIDPYYPARIEQLNGMSRPHPIAPPGDPTKLLAQEIESNKKHAHLLKLIYDIARDGHVNEKDAPVVADYMKLNAELIEQLARTAAAIVALSQQNGHR